MSVSLDDSAEHVLKRATAFGRWMPAALYLVNIAGWLATAFAAGATELLYLAVFTLPAITLYVWRTGKAQP